MGHALKNMVLVVLSVSLLSSARLTFLDTYSSFKTTRYYSDNRRYFFEVKPNHAASFYKNVRTQQPIWTRKLSWLPGNVLISNDGKRVVLLDRYYGNGGSPDVNVVSLIDERGAVIAEHKLKTVANLERISYTTSSAHWYLDAALNPDAQSFTIDTAVKKCERPSQIRSLEDVKLADQCDKLVPYERLRFDLKNGAIISRISLE